MNVNKINKIAKKEGWGIFECYGSEEGFIQIQKIDDEDKFKNDMEAIRFVLKLAKLGSYLHKKAINISSDNLVIKLTNED